MTGKFYCIEPEVAGGLGEHTVMDRAVTPPRVEKLHYQLDGWLGDALLESFPCFIVTGSARNAILATALTGVDFSDVEITTSEEFKALYPDRVLPSFSWLKPVGAQGVDDFAVSVDGRLILSEKMLSVFRKLGIPNALISEYEG